MRRRPLILVVALVGFTLLYLWKKVELARIDQRLSEIENEVGDLREEDARLRATIDQYSKPRTIKKIAAEKLDMIYPTGQVDELILENEGRSATK
jgi:cell division protein FtsB